MGLSIYQRDVCPVCKENKSKTIYKSNFYEYPIKDYLDTYYLRNNIDFKFLEGAKFIIEECLICGLIYQKHILNNEYMIKLYNEWLIVTEEKEIKRPFKNYQIISKEIENIFRHFQNSKSCHKFLDYGAGWGEWSMMAQAYGAEVYALELSEAKQKYLQKHGIKVIALKDISQHKFDFINTEQVFEHVSDPHVTINFLSNSLSKDGIIKISVPNGSLVKKNLIHPDWFAPRFGSKSLMPIQPLEHINCFRKGSVDYMAELNNLKRLKMNTVNLNKYFLDITMRDILFPVYKFIFQKTKLFNLCLYYQLNRQ